MPEVKQTCRTSSPTTVKWQRQLAARCLQAIVWSIDGLAVRVPNCKSKGNRAAAGGQGLNNSTGMVPWRFSSCLLSMAGGLAWQVRQTAIAPTWHLNQAGESLIYVAHLLRSIPAAADRACGSASKAMPLAKPSACMHANADRCIMSLRGAARSSPLAVDRDAKVKAEWPHAGTCTVGQRLAGHLFQK